jgi:hypothetical protein
LNRLSALNSLVAASYRNLVFVKQGTNRAIGSQVPVDPAK